MEAAVAERLDRWSERTGRGRAELLNAYADEGLRMEAHPNVVFRSGPAGRRPALVDGPDVWEIVRVVRNVPERDEEAIAAAAEWLGLRPDQVESAVAYYSDYRDEVDAWIARVDAEAEERKAALDRRRQVLA